VGRRADGKVAFVSHVMPGETVLARVEREHASYCTADALKILEPSPARVTPECPLFTRCGGCDWQHIPYDVQVAWKGRILSHEIARAAGLEGVASDDPVRSERPYGYRGHVVLQCDGPELGFFRKGTNRLAAVESCPVLNPRLQGLIPGLRRIIGEEPLAIRSLELHAPQEEVILQARCESSDGKAITKAMERMHRELGIDGVSFVSLRERRRDHVLGKRSCRYCLAVSGGRVEISCAFGEFIQANLPVNQAMVGHVVGLARGAERIVDLYCGSGNFSIPLAKSAREVVAVERSRGLVSHGRKSAARNGAGNVVFHDRDVAQALRDLGHELKGADAVVLDPPREGAKEAVRLLPELGATRIIYISCNPTTMARDLKPLLQAGYGLAGLRLFDMFPQTHHIESVVFLTR